jgi:hypothetical protein
MRSAAIIALAAAVLAAGPAFAQQQQQQAPMRVAIKCTPNLEQTSIRDVQPGLTVLELKGTVSTKGGTAFNLFVINRDTQAVVGEQTVAVMTNGNLTLSIPIYKLEAGRYAVGLGPLDGNGIAGKCFFDVLRN